MSASPTELPPFDRLGPAVPRHPVIVAVPHAGRAYPPALIDAAQVSTGVLAALEDRHADRLADQALAEGTTVFIAHNPRAWIDLNRGEREIDPAMLDPRPPPGAMDENARVRGGLGLVPRRGPGGVELWRRPFTPGEIAARIAADHRPWHDAIAAALAVARARFGCAVLLDLHSMPPLRSGGGVPAPHIVIGDRHGASAGRPFRDRLCTAARAHGLRHAVNAPYAGGYTLDRHGRPGHHIHALQLEVDRAMYLAADLRAPGPGLDAARWLVAAMVSALADQALDGGMLAAAE